MWVWLLRLFGFDPAKATKQLEVLPASVTEHGSEQEKSPAADGAIQSSVVLSPPASELSEAAPLARTELSKQPPAEEDQPAPESTARPAAVVLVPPTAVVLQDLARPGLFRPAYGATRQPKFLSPDQIVRGALELNPSPAITVKPDLVLEETPEPAALPASPRRIEPLLSMEFFLQVEFILFSEPDPQRSSEANRRFALTPQARAAGALLRDGVLDRWRQQKPPLGPEEFYDMALAMAPGPSGALQLCHNVARTFADGGAAIPAIPAV